MTSLDKSQSRGDGFMYDFALGHMNFFLSSLVPICVCSKQCRLSPCLILSLWASAKLCIQGPFLSCQTGLQILHTYKIGQKMEINDHHSLAGHCAVHRSKEKCQNYETFWGGQIWHKIGSERAPK